MSKIRQAIDFATKVHLGQKRKYSGEDYINHPLEVMTIVSEVTGDEDTICAAILHDTIEENKGESIDYQIQDIFGNTVYRYVVCLTPCFTRKNCQSVGRQERKRLEIRRMLTAPDEVKTIKLADILSNCKDVVKNDPGFARVYLEEKWNALWFLTEGNKNLFERAFKLLLEQKKILNNS